MKTESTYINFEELPDGSLKITLTDEGREELTERKENDNYMGIWSSLLEETQCNGSYGLVTPDEVGALTDSIIIVNNVDINDEGDFVEHEDTKYWWFPNYMVIDELQELLDNNEVIFSKGY